MRIYFLLLCCGLLAGPAPAAETAADPEPAARAVSARVAAEPDRVAELFDKSLFRHISLEKLTGVLAGLYRDHGAVSRTVLVSSAAGSGHFYFDTERGYRVPVALSLNPATGKINGIFFGAAYRKDVTLKEVREKLAALPGSTGLLVRRLGEKPEDLEAHNGEVRLAVGSAFKLYVLGALLREGVPWERVYRLKKEDISLPTGRLRDWPAGSPLTVHTLAALMISESDNTASDALISALGRRVIEGNLAALGHGDPSRLRPFLRTSEMFRLKSGTERALEYLNLPLPEKYDFLSGLARAPLSAEAFTKSPFGVDKIEWFASPADLCRLMGFFAEKKDEKALEILALNPGLSIPRGALPYAGYKGGSEPGVLSMTWLLKDRKGDWLCLSAAWNDEKDNLEEKEFFALLQAALNALGEK